MWMMTPASKTLVVPRYSTANLVRLSIFNVLELFLSMKGDSIFEVEKPAEEEPKDEDDNAEYSGKIYERMDDEELCNAHR